MINTHFESKFPGEEKEENGGSTRGLKRDRKPPQSFGEKRKHIESTEKRNLLPHKKVWGVCRGQRWKIDKIMITSSVDDIKYRRKTKAGYQKRKRTANGGQRGGQDSHRSLQERVEEGARKKKKSIVYKVPTRRREPRGKKRKRKKGGCPSLPRESDCVLVKGTN